MLRSVSAGTIESGLLSVDAALVPELGADASGGLGAIAAPLEPSSSLAPVLPLLDGASISDWSDDDNLFPSQPFEPDGSDIAPADSFSSPVIQVPPPIDLGAAGVNVPPSASYPPGDSSPSQTPVTELPPETVTRLSEPEEAVVVDSAIAEPDSSELVPVELQKTPPDLQALKPLVNYRGELSEEDDYNPLRFATFKDDYILDVGEDSTVQVSLTSSTFDTYLQLIRFGSDEVFVFDDDSGQSRNAQLSLQVKQGDRFIVRATSYDSEAIGQYRLSLNSTGSGLVTPDGGNSGDGENPADPFNLPVDGGVQPDPERFNGMSGYGLVNTAAAVAAALNLAQPELTEPFAEAPDLGGQDQPLDMLQVPEAWAQGFTGSDVTIAVIDSGLDISHPELESSLWVNSNEIAGDGIDNDQNGYIDDVNGWNFGRNQLNNEIEPGTDSPFQGHGTHVAGIIAGANDGNGNTGVAYDAKIMPLRLGDTNNAGIFLNPGNLATAVRYAVDNGADVINLSLGWSDSPALRTALEYAADNNVVVVGASGNRGFSIPVSPARYAIDWGLSVGAVTASGRLATFSNGAGSNAEIRHVLAPGNSIFSAAPGGGYETRTGTSMAAPYVSGVVALMLSANPNLTNVQVRDILAATATTVL